MKRAAATSLAAVLLAAASPSRGATTNQFPIFMPITPPPAIQNAIGSIPLTEEVFGATDDAYSNLRLFGVDGRETPYWLRPRTIVKVDVITFEFKAATLGFKEMPGNTAEVIVRRDADDPAPVGIRIASPVRNFDKQVAISGSDDQQAWTELAAGTIFDYTRFIDVRSFVIRFETRPYRFYRLTLSAITAQKDSPLVQIVRQKGGLGNLTESEAFSFEREPFRIDAVHFLGRREQIREAAVRQSAWTVPTIAISEDAKRKATVIQFSNPRLPAGALILRMKNRNFSRQVMVEGAHSADEKDWRELGRGTVSAIHAGQVSADETTNQLPREARFAWYRVTIFNQDNPPLEIDQIQLLRNEYELLFFPVPTEGYRLYCGGASLQPPQYDVAATLARTPERAGDTWTLGAPAANPAYAPDRGKGPRWVNSRTFLTIALLLMVAVLLYAVARLAKKTEQPPAGTE